MKSGRYTSRRLVEMYLERIEEIDRTGPTLRSVIEVNPDALAIADALDAERKAKGARGPLHGIPVLIKDNIDTADRMMTTAGSLALEGSIAARDAFVVERLRAAGAVILGKTNLSEWANFRSTKSHERLERARRAGEEPVRRSIATRADRARDRARPSRRTSRRPASAPRPTDRSSARRRPTGWSASSRRSVSSAAPASSRFRTARTRPARWRARSRCRDAARGRLPGVDPRDAETKRVSRQAGSVRESARMPARFDGARIGVARKRYFGYSPATDRLVGARDRRAEGARCGDRRSRRHPDGGPVRRLRVRGPALRVQGRSERLPDGARSRRQGSLARRS